MKRVIIFTGGSTDINFLKKQEFLKEDFIICADHGLETAHDLSLVPNLLVGDFDSVNQKVLAQYKGREGIGIVRFRPEKDDTDTELALHMALDTEPEEILIYGGFGTRLDHTIANIGLLRQPFMRGIKAVMCDAFNRLCMVQGSYRIRRDEAFGEFVSILPYFGDAKGVTLKGFKYLLKDAVMKAGSSLGVSNEIVAEEGVIEVREGIVLVVESRD
jgi:thiamine pyrophosphokinase